MPRADQGKTLAVASLAFSGAAAGTMFSSGGMSTPAMLAMLGGLVVALSCFVYARRVEDATDAKKHEIALNERVECEGGLCNANGIPYKLPKRKLWRLPVPWGTAACAKCYELKTGHAPVNGKDKRAF